jgi:glycosyltransferase involved in cell wall biosynthesis
VDVLIDAIAITRDVHGLVVGGHPGEADLARVRGLVARLNLESRVTITGLVPPHGVRARLAAAGVLVVPNTLTAISERYTSPLKLFEYLTMGRPIVASNLPAIREIVTNDKDALLVTPGDAKALADALVRLQSDSALAARLVKGAAALAPRYSWDARAALLETALTVARAS